MQFVSSPQNLKLSYQIRKNVFHCTAVTSYKMLTVVSHSSLNCSKQIIPNVAAVRRIFAAALAYGNAASKLRYDMNIMEFLISQINVPSNHPLLFRLRSFIWNKCDELDYPVQHLRRCTHTKPTQAVCLYLSIHTYIHVHTYT